MSSLIPFVPRTRDTSAPDDSGLVAPVVPLADRAVYTVREVAYLLSLSLGNTYELLRNGTIPAERLGRRWVIPRARFHAWLDGAAVEPAPVASTGASGRRVRQAR